MGALRCEFGQLSPALQDKPSSPSREKMYSVPSTGEFWLNSLPRIMHVDTLSVRRSYLMFAYPLGLAAAGNIEPLREPQVPVELPRDLGVLRLRGPGKNA